MSDLTATDYAAKQLAEWSKYVATEPIFIDGVLAFKTDDPVPAGHVDRKDAPVGKHQVRRADVTTTEKG